jgi:type IV pilus assembly protein PilM
LFSLKKKILIGIDIGQHSVKAAVLNSNKKEIFELLETILLPDRKLFEEKPTDENIAMQCKQMLTKYVSPKSQYQSVISVSVQGDGAVCNYLELPQMDKKKTETAIQSAIVSSIPYPVDKAVIRYIPVVPLSTEGERKNAFFLIAIKKEFMDRKKRLLKDLDLHESNFDIYVSPLIKSITHNHGNFEGQFIAVVHTGCRMTSVFVLRDGNPYFMRNFSIAGYDFIYSFQMAEQSSWKEAEEYMFAYDIARKEIALEPNLIRWKDQIKKSLDSFIKTNANINPSISRIILSGGTSQLKGLDKYLAENLDIPTEADRWEKLKPGKGQNIDFIGKYNIAIGLNF